MLEKVRNLNFIFVSHLKDRPMCSFSKTITFLHFFMRMATPSLVRCLPDAFNLTNNTPSLKKRMLPTVFTRTWRSGTYFYCKSVCLSVCDVRADGLNFQQCFCAISYSSHPLTSLQNFIEIVLGEPVRRGLNARGVAKYSDVGHAEGYISETVQDTISGTIND